MGIFIEYIFKTNPAFSKRIYKAYRISYSTFKKFKEQLGGEENKSTENKMDMQESQQKQEEQVEIIKNIVSPPKPPITVKLIQEKIFESHQQNLTNYRMRKILREDLRFRYRKG